MHQYFAENTGHENKDQDFISIKKFRDGNCRTGSIRKVSYISSPTFSNLTLKDDFPEFSSTAFFQPTHHIIIPIH